MRSRLPAPLAALTLLVAILQSPTAQAAICDGISSASDAPLTTVRIVSGLSRPLLVTAPPGDVDRLFVLEQDGRVRIVKQGALLPAAFLDIGSITRSPADGGGDEQGLLGLAFRPNYAANGWFFVYHTDNSGNNVLARYTRSGTNPDLADPASRQVVLTFAHPSFDNHNGGMLAFGPDDGDLYVATGDGGGSCDSFDNSQNGASNLGKLLRINVDGLPYTVPSDNPFVGPDGVNDEIWALGLRNPWRYCFDRANADLYIADVGQNVWEEIDYRVGTDPGGENYGWDLFEGSHCPNPSCGTPDCNAVPGTVLPVLEYQHLGGACSITGGYVYRGCRMPNLRGTYFYGDYCAAFIKSLRMVGGSVTALTDRTAELAPGGGLSINSITSFGEDARGEIYIVDRGGEVFKILPILANLQVSGPEAAPFAPGASDWVWEDLKATSGHPITEYRVYRTAGNGSGTFDCVFHNSVNVWPGGDPASPAPGGVFSYLVTALNAAGQATSPGTGSNGTPRTLSSAPCPP